MKLLIDCDIARYQIGSIKVKNPFNKKSMIPAPIETIHYHTEELIKNAIKATKATEYLCVLSGKGNFRHEIAKSAPYKGNRDPNTARPYHYDTVGLYILDNHPSIVVDGIEADDYLGIEQRKDLENTITGSRDKDLDTYPGYHYRWACGESQPERPLKWISHFEAIKFFFTQMLTGDNTDNILGCGIRKEVMWGGKLVLRRKGVGKKGAEDILSNCTTVAQMYIAIHKEYTELFGDQADEIMLENARLLYIGQLADNLFNWDWINYDLYHFRERETST